MALHTRRNSLALLSALVLSMTAIDGSAQDDMTSLRREVLAILRERYPERSFAPGPEDDIVLSGDARFALGNLQFYLSSDPAERRATILAWFERGFKASNPDPLTGSWDAFRSKLRPKLVPTEYVRDAPTMVYRPFSDEVRLAYVVDEGDRDRYVLAPLLEGWGASADAVHEYAIANLEAMSEHIGLRRKAPQSGRGAFVTVHEKDAYDAVRIVLPRFRARLREALGPDPRVGIPNRDFLVAWSKDFDAEAGFIARVEEDTRVQPYPLTKQIFVIGEEGLRPL